MHKRLVMAGVLVALAWSWTSLQAWGGQGHRLVGLVAANHLSRAAGKQVAWLLDGQSLADIASWADGQVTDWQQTAPWHYLNIPPDATGYDRDRDCPRQPGVRAGARADTWRDCAVDRIGYFEQRLADGTLDRADRQVTGPGTVTPCFAANVAHVARTAMAGRGTVATTAAKWHVTVPGPVDQAAVVVNRVLGK